MLLPIEENARVMKPNERVHSSTIGNISIALGRGNVAFQSSLL